MSQDLEKTQMADAGRTQMVSRGGAEPTQMAINVKCPVCGTVSHGGDQYCPDCGFLLSQTGVSVLPGDAMGQTGVSVLPRLVEASSGREFELKPGVNTIGRQDTDVLVNHPTVSRSHATITVSEDSYLLEDMGSTNGTFVGNKKVEPGQPMEIEPGMEILFGSAMMRLESPVPEEFLEVSDAVEREKLAEESVKVEEAAEIPPSPAVEAEPAEHEAADAEELAEIPVMTGPDEATDATPEQALEPPIEPEEIHEEEPTLARLIASDGTDYIIKPGENSIGRRPTNNISIPDPYISGSHAVITASEGSFVLTDIGSTNGTFVNGEKLSPNEPRELNDGDEVKLAEVTLRFTV